jgi:hypothetical protein
VLVTSRCTAIAKFSAPSFPPANLSDVFVSDGNVLLLIETDTGKFAFPDEVTGVAEWMWVRVTGCDDAKQLVFGTLDNAPVSDSSGKLKLGTELAIS